MFCFVSAELVKILQMLSISFASLSSYTRVCVLSVWFAWESLTGFPHSFSLSLSFSHSPFSLLPSSPSPSFPLPLRPPPSPSPPLLLSSLYSSLSCLSLAPPPVSTPLSLCLYHLSIIYLLSACYYLSIISCLSLVSSSPCGQHKSCLSHSFFYQLYFL